MVAVWSQCGRWSGDAQRRESAGDEQLQLTGTTDGHDRRGTTGRDREGSEWMMIADVGIRWGCIRYAQTAAERRDLVEQAAGWRRVASGRRGEGEGEGEGGEWQ